MITTVTLNATIDKTCYVGSLRLGEVNRMPVMQTAPGGKGINSARVAHSLGCPVLTTGYTAGFNGSYIETELSRRGILHDFVRVDGESRVSLNVIHASTGQTTEFLEAGPLIKSDDVLAIKDKLAQVATFSSIISLNGSLPRGAPDTLYADFIEIAHQEGVLTVLDAKGEALRRGIEAVPTCIKPNEHEMADYVGKDKLTDEELDEAIGKLQDIGIRIVAVSLGARGAMIGMDGSLYKATVPEFTPVNVVGCGDAFVGGLCTALYKKETPEQLIRISAACGSAEAMTLEAGHIQLDDVKSIIKQIRIDKLR